ncbi:MAG: hypothetical protein OEW52_00180 [Thermoleophilia bacterium]|nr:hypothetical protein [Thermoleophilia bacterium]
MTTETRRAYTWRQIQGSPFGFATTIRGHQVTVYTERREERAPWHLEIRQNGELVRPRSEHHGPAGAMATAVELLDEKAGDGSQPATGRDCQETTNRGDNLHGSAAR